MKGTTNGAKLRSLRWSNGRGHAGECQQENMDSKAPNIPLVGCLAYDTENLFTAGIESSSEEIKQAFGITSFCSHSKNVSSLIFKHFCPHKTIYNKQVKVTVGPDVGHEYGDSEKRKTPDGHNKWSRILSCYNVLLDAAWHGSILGAVSNVSETQQHPVDKTVIAAGGERIHIKC